MITFVKTIVIAVTISLVGCGGAVHRQGETVTAYPSAAAETIGDCENTLYYSSDADPKMTLHCANILDVWR